MDGKHRKKNAKAATDEFIINNNNNHLGLLKGAAG